MIIISPHQPRPVCPGAVYHALHSILSHGALKKGLKKGWKEQQQYVACPSCPSEAWPSPLYSPSVRSPPGTACERKCNDDSEPGSRQGSHSLEEVGAADRPPRQNTGFASSGRGRGRTTGWQL